MPGAGRYAPSPSGALHLGNLRTALLAWLFARSAGAGFLLRIEDLDPQRSRREHEEGQLADLRAIGIDWDGEPVRQSDRTELYREAVERLRAEGRVYPCWCTRAEIRLAAQAPHGPLPEGAYPGTCRELSAAQRARREREAGRPPSLRLDARARTVTFEDRLHGTVRGTVDDFLLRRYDGTFSYHVAVVVDDADQGVGEVVRGDDLLGSTARQLLLGSLLGMPAPAYAHVPLVLGPDGRRLAKRHGAVTLADRRALGQGPGEVLNWMAASAGLVEPGEQVTAHGLIERFDARDLRREATVLED
jgi:glutamyl-tRNA synthetase